MLAIETNHPALKVSGVRNFTEATLKGPYRARGGVVHFAIQFTDPVQVVPVQLLLPFLDANAPPCRYSAGVSGWVLIVELEFHDTLLAILRIVVYNVRDGPLDRPFGLVVCEVRSERPRDIPIYQIPGLDPDSNPVHLHEERNVIEKAAVPRGPGSSCLDPRADVEPKSVHRAAWRCVCAVFIARRLVSRFGPYESYSQVFETSGVGHTGVRCCNRRELVVREIVLLSRDDGGEAVRVEI